MAKRRLRIYRVDEQLFSTIFTETGDVRRFCVIQGLPKDAKFVSLNAHWESRCVKLMYEHESFEVCEEGQTAAEYSMEIILTGDYTGEQTTRMREALDGETKRRVADGLPGFTSLNCYA